MMKTSPGLFLLILFFSFHGFSQCLTPLPAPACNGNEPLVLDGDIVSGGTTKWYYGSTATITTLTLDGGSLVVCGDLTIDKFYITTGKIFIRQGARLVIGSGLGAGLQFKGDCAIYNYGTCEIQRNLTLENNAAAATPNIVFNALNSSVFLMSNQYFVINNAYSWFVNNGRAECWGIITDSQSSPASVCLGNGSSTKMAILINKIADSYTVPAGNACLHVFQLSEFYGKLTSSATLNVCLGGSHTSSTSCIPFGCQPNNWGAAQLFTNCTGCAAINIALPLHSIALTGNCNNDGTNKLHWETDPGIRDGTFTVLRSGNGIRYSTIDSFTIDENSAPTFNLIDNHPIPGNNFYMIRYTNIHSGLMLSSRIVKVISKIKAGFNIYPVPFRDKFIIDYEQGTQVQKLLLTDTEGRNIRIRYTIQAEARSVEVIVLNQLQPGLYIIYVKTDKKIMVKPIFRK